MKITVEQLWQIMPTSRASGRAGLYVDNLNKYMAAFDINTPLRAAHFLAQLAHESGEMRYTHELGNAAYFKKYEPGTKIGKSLGNTQPGDGAKYKGRGFFQITGRANYAAYKAFCGFDVLAKPELLEQQPGVVRSAGWYWSTRRLNRYADADNLEAVTKAINGGLNGLAQRRTYLARAKKALSL